MISGFSNPGKIFRMTWFLSYLFWASCGASDDSNDDLSVYSGLFDVLETFDQDTGTQCPTPPTGVTENSITLTIEGKQLEASFELLWGVLYGDIQTDKSFHATGNVGSQEEKFDFSGVFKDLDTLEGLMKRIKTGCTRSFKLEGKRQGST